MPRKKTYAQFCIGAETVHGVGRYDYSGVIYINCKTKITIRCTVCELVFTQTPVNHLSGNGCPRCNRGSPGLNKKTHAQFCIDAEAVHGVGRYDYSGGTYLGSRTKFNIRCTECSLVFSQLPTNHLSGNGCRRCNLGDALQKRLLPSPTTLYYIKFSWGGRDYWKIGITTKTVVKRFMYGGMNSIEVLWDKLYSTGHIAYGIEQNILKKFNWYRLYDPTVLPKNGWTEVFTEDVLSPLLARL